MTDEEFQSFMNDLEKQFKEASLEEAYPYIKEEGYTILYRALDEAREKLELGKYKKKKNKDFEHLLSK